MSHRPIAVSKKTLAGLLDVSETTVDTWVRQGLLPRPMKIGGSTRWRLETVERALAEREQAPQLTDEERVYRATGYRP